MIRYTLLFLLSTITTLGFAQKPSLDHTVYNDWKSLKSHRISSDGNFVSYEITPHRGDGYLYIHDVQANTLDSIYRAKNAKFAGDASFLAFSIHPNFDTIRSCKLNKVKKEKWPKDSLGIHLFSKDSLIVFPKVTTYKINEENGWILYLEGHNKLSEGKKKKRWCKRKRKPEPASDGKVLVIYHPSSGEEYRFKNVTEMSFSENGNQVVYTTHQKVEKENNYYLNTFNFDGKASWTHPTVFSSIGKKNFNEQETHLAFLASNDTSKHKVYGLHLLDLATGNDQIIADTNQSFLTSETSVSEHFSPLFTEKGDLLYFGVSNRPEPEEKDTLLDSEKVKLDVWHYEDKRLQPQQLLELKRDEKRSNLFVFNTNDQSVQQLSNDTLRVYPDDDPKGEYLLGTSNERYAHTYNWVTPYPKDHYRVSLKTGESTLIREGTDQSGELSPTGRYYIYFTEGNYHAIDFNTGDTTCITCDVDNVNWVGDINGMPMKAYPLGTIGWEQNDEAIWLQSEYDIWKYNFIQQAASSVTNEEGKERTIELRPRFWEYDSVYLNYDNIYVSGFNRVTKGVHLFNFRAHDGHMDLNELSSHDAMVVGIQKAKKADQITLRKMTFNDYSDAYLANSSFETTQKISTTNPQQSDYNWASVELVKWESYDGTPLEGLLYKPENYDSTKSYPLMVYFYELYSHRYHQHYIPKPTASIVYPTEYASAGYLVFIPDIRYKPGHPAQSAYDCIMSGTDRILELYPTVDSTRMALQGQSWGGYQTAQLVTMTNRYKAAMAGAPVTNMFSAYGGIRWGSGLNRQFQYERTQSRIGYTIWERPELYVENSPQFHLPKVSTPLLIMHNDNDGAVPWYQGIELFTGLKRLGKTSWLLNYNDEAHNLRRNANRIDLSIRMRQFFDYYLLDQPAPKWMVDGIPAKEKGKELRYELTE